MVKEKIKHAHGLRPAKKLPRSQELSSPQTVSSDAKARQQHVSQPKEVGTKKNIGSFLQPTKASLSRQQSEPQQEERRPCSNTRFPAARKSQPPSKQHNSNSQQAGQDVQELPSSPVGSSTSTEGGTPSLSERLSAESLLWRVNRREKRQAARLGHDEELVVGPSSGKLWDAEVAASRQEEPVASSIHGDVNDDNAPSEKVTKQDTRKDALSTPIKSSRALQLELTTAMLRESQAEIKRCEATLTSSTALIRELEPKILSREVRMESTMATINDLRAELATKESKFESSMARMQEFRAFIEEREAKFAEARPVEWHHRCCDGCSGIRNICREHFPVGSIRSGFVQDEVARIDNRSVLVDMEDTTSSPHLAYPPPPPPPPSINTKTTHDVTARITIHANPDDLIIHGVDMALDECEEMDSSNDALPPGYLDTLVGRDGYRHLISYPAVAASARRDYHLPWLHALAWLVKNLEGAAA